jgi:hypothetical protein
MDDDDGYRIGTPCLKLLDQLGKVRAILLIKGIKPREHIVNSVDSISQRDHSGGELCYLEFPLEMRLTSGISTIARPA